MRIRDLILAATPITLIAVGVAKSRAQPLQASFIGFREHLVRGGTTTRRRDGAKAIDFWHYPLIDLNPDISGDFTVVWRYRNTVDGAFTFDSLDITNVFTVQARVTNRLELHHIGPTADPRRGESIAIGDLDNPPDGRWHTFRSEVTATIKSPTGATITVSGALQDEFSTVLPMSATFVGFREQLVRPD